MAKLIIATPNTNSWMFRFKFKQNWFSLQPPGHLQLFNLKNLSNVLHKQGIRDRTEAKHQYEMSFTYMQQVKQ